jgi:hypothetical protein
MTLSTMTFLTSQNYSIIYWMSGYFPLATRPKSWNCNKVWNSSLPIKCSLNYLGDNSSGENVLDFDANNINWYHYIHYFCFGVQKYVLGTFPIWMCCLFFVCLFVGLLACLFYVYDYVYVYFICYRNVFWIIHLLAHANVLLFLTGQAIPSLCRQRRRWLSTRWSGKTCCPIPLLKTRSSLRI